MTDDREVFRELADLSEAYADQERKVERLELQLKQAKERFEEIRTESLPDLMASLHQPTVTVPSTGQRIEVEDVVWIAKGITRDPEVHDWLDSTGNGHLVRRQVLVEFNREQHEEARALLEALRYGIVVGDDRVCSFPYAREEGVVHYQSLLKLVKDRLAETEDVPEELLGVIVKQVAKFIKKG